jgi:hypothetical protein
MLKQVSFWDQTLHVFSESKPPKKAASNLKKLEALLPETEAGLNHRPPLDTLEELPEAGAVAIILGEKHASFGDVGTGWNGITLNCLSFLARTGRSLIPDFFHAPRFFHLFDVCQRHRHCPGWTQTQQPRSGWESKAS